MYAWAENTVSLIKFNAIVNLIAYEII